MPRHRWIVVAALIGTAALLAGCNVAWLQWGGESSHQNDNTAESTLTPANVAQVTQRWQANLPSVADGTPAVAFGMSTPGGTHDMVFVTTRAGDLVAFDLHTGAQLWSVSFGPGSCKINNGSSTCYTTSSPAVDQSGGFVYTYGLDGKVHKVAIGTGVENTTAPWPVLVTLKPFDEKGSSALSMVTAAGHTYLYMTTAGYPGDGGDYQGHLTTIDLATGASTVFNTLCSYNTAHLVETPGTPDCSEIQSGVWARPGTTYSSATGLIYLATGNGAYSPSVFDWGDSVVALHPNGTGTATNAPVDCYTPTNYETLNTTDQDLGSTLPALVKLPAGALAPDGSSLSEVGIQGGKDAKLRLLDTADLSQQGGCGHTGGEWDLIAGPGGQILTEPTIWTDSSGTIWAEVGTGSHLAGYTVTLDPTTHVPALTLKWNVATGSTTPMVAGSVAYSAGGTQIRAYDPTTGAVLWSTSVGSIHWQSPVVTAGIILLEDGAGHLTAWSRPGT